MIRSSILLLGALCFLSAAPRLALCDDAAKSPTAHWTSDAETAIRKALAGKAEFEFNNTPLADAVNAISKEYDVPFVIDEAAMEADGLDPTIPVSLSVSGISLRSALSLALEPLQLTTIVQDEVLKVTTLLEAETNLSVRVYPVADLLGTTHFENQEVPDFDTLIELIITIVDPDTWDEVGGDGSTSPSELLCSLVISQTEESHGKVSDLLQALRRVPPIDDSSQTDSSIPSAIWVGDETPSRLAKALKKRISLEGEMPLCDFAKSLSRQLQIPVLVDDASLEADGLDSSVPVSCDLPELPVPSALRLALEPVQLTSVVHNEVLMVTTLLEAETELRAVVYPVLDLVQLYETSDTEPLDFDSLIETITSTIDPDTWDEVGGDASIMPFGVNATLVISQTQESHDRIQVLLSQLRAAKAVQSVPLLRKPDPGEMITRIHTLGGLTIDRGDLEEIIVRVVDPKGWHSSPDVFIKASMDKLIVRHRRDVQEQITDFMRELDKTPSESVPFSPRSGGGF